jgi:hypothetical protein
MLRGEVLTQGTREEGIPFALEILDNLEGKQAERLVGQTVVFLVVPVISDDPAMCHDALIDRSLGDASL